MMVAYIIGATGFAAICSIVCFLLGASMSGVLAAYVVSGQAALLSLVAVTACRRDCLRAVGRR
ncbi:hypothetical protein [Sulfitobacter aestuariivivens]|uniref:Uncharacterized protein n=1 Tax=Sulfitobacter aestuariivivens TaxID=2766981 RepID=A0A927D4A8_9RHOB|nr:hypothetical protein [Sulfitobacter aestuariivivens]MBD3662982.1 hypothetical protein [Sulfitobacter aestuariivivens]